MSTNPVAPSSLLQPELLESQIGGGIGASGVTVNKFRGDVTLPLPLTSLPGVQGVNIALTALNASNVFRVAKRDNAQAPTSILGLGWSLPRERIVVIGKATLDITDGTYAIEQNGRLTPLTLIEKEGGSYLFATNGHPLWQFRYDPSAESWTIVTPDGGKRLYGGRVAGACEWGLSWNGWIGASAAANATPYAVVWNLVRLQSAWGLGIDFTYDADTLQVGAAGSYTRASYLARISDDLGQAVELRYGDKEPFEWVCPHLNRGLPDPTYQDRYETRYLKSLTEFSNAKSATAMRTLVFDYQMFDFAGAGQDIYRKRALMGFRTTVNGIVASPDVRFQYVTDPAAPWAGALSSVLNPSGATTKVSYSSITLNAAHNPAFDKTLPIAPPPGSQGSRPYILPSEDYMALTWVHPTKGTLAIQVYSFGGAWSKPWSPDLDLAGTVDPNGIAYVQAGDKFALFLPPVGGTAGASARLILFRRDPYQGNVWHADMRTIRLTASVSKVTASMAGGDNFVAISIAGQGRFQIFTFDPASVEWKSTSFTPSGENIVLATDGSCLIAAAVSNSTRNLELTSYTRNLDLSWRLSGGPRVKNGVTWRSEYFATLLNCSPNFCAVTYAADQGTHLDLLTWDGRGAFVGERSFQATTATTRVSPRIVINGPHVFRFDAGTWKGFTFTDSPQASYVIGDDFALRSLKVGAPNVVLIRYKPTTGAWDTEQLPGANAVIYPPTLAGNIMTCGTKVYRRQLDQTWKPIADLSESGDPATLVNRGSFIIYAERRPNGKKRIIVLLLGDDSKVVTATFDDQWFGGGGDWFTAGACAASRCFATYPDKLSPLAPSSLFLNRILDNSLSSIQTDEVVSSVETDDGYQRRGTAYAYDNVSALFEPSGQIVQYPFVTEFLVDQSGKEIGGRIESRYYNGLPIPDDPVLDPYHDLVVGREHSTDVFTNEGLRIFGRRTRWQPLVYAHGAASKVGVRFPAATAVIGEAITWDCLVRLFAAPATVATSFDAGTIPASVKTQFSDAGLALDPAASVKAVIVGVSWQITSGSSVYAARHIVSGDIEITTQLERRRQQGYEDQSGSMVDQRATNRTPDGNLETVAIKIVRAWTLPQYDGLLRTRQLDLIAETRITNVTRNVTIASSVTTFSDQWGHANAPFDSVAGYEWNGPGSVAPDFNYSNPESNTEWVRTTSVSSRAPTGLALVWRNALDVPSSQILDARAVRPIASFRNADSGHRGGGGQAEPECSYMSFEAYQDGGPWRTTDGSPIAPLVSTARAHTGKASLELSNGPNAPGIRGQFAVRPGAGQLAVNFWLYNEAATGPFGAILLRFGGGQTYKIELASTAGAWARHQRAISVPAGAAGSFTIEAVNAGASTNVFIDDLMVFPLPGSAEAGVFDADTLLVTARLDANAATTRSYYDEGYNVLASTNARGELIQLATGGYSRQLSAADAYDPAWPNTSFAVKARDGGSFETFNDDGWRSRWRPTPQDAWSPTAGTALAGRLTLNSTTGGSLAWARSGVESLVLRAWISPPAAGWTAAVGIAIANVGTVEWNHDASALRILDSAGTERARRAMPGLAAAEWIVTRTGDAIALYVNGQPLVSAVIPGKAGAIEIRTSGNSGLTISGLAVLSGPAIALSFADGLSTALQRQLFAESGAIVGGTLKDSLGRSTVSSKPVRYDDGLPRYRSHLIEALDWSSGVMRGDVATYYDGRDGRSNDEGFPYSRVVLEMAGVQRQRASGSPGRVHAIFPGAAHVVESATITNVRSDFGKDVAAGIFLGTETRNSDGARVRSFTDDRMSEFFRCYIAPPRLGLRESRSGRRFNQRGQLAAMLPPMFYSQGSEAYIQTREADPLGKISRTHSSDSGETRTLYDRLNRTRFALVADGRGKGTGGTDRIVYMKYDALDRVIESGTVDHAWDPKVLAPLANTDWPTDGQWVARVAWDCVVSGNNPAAMVDPNNGIGLQASVQRPLQAGGFWTQTSTFDADGGLVGLSQSDGAVGRRQRYDLDMQGDLAALTFDTHAAAVTVTYRRDLQGNVVAVGDGRDPARWATYRYTAEGSRQEEVLNPSSPRPVRRSFVYNSMGLLTDVQCGVLGEAYRYWEVPGVDGVTYYDGQVARAMFLPGEAAKAAGLGPDDWSNAYDANGNLCAAVNSDDAQRSIGGPTDPILYDANDNIVSMMDRGVHRSFSIEPGTNKTVSMSSPEGVETFEFSPGGNLTAAKGRRFDRLEYGLTNGLVSKAHTTSGSTVSIDYGEGDARVRTNRVDGRGTAAARTDYLHDTDGQVLTQAGDDIGSMTYIPGPFGLVAVLDGNRTPGFIVRDRQNSTRLVVAEDGSLLAGYAYEPFGGMAQAPVGPWRDRIRYLYIAQELDPDTGLYNLNARLYDPVLRRFVSIDPLRSTASPYVYVSNIPFQTSDPSGLLAFLLALAIGAIVGAIIGGGVSALTYTATHDWKVDDWGEFWKEVGIGAAVGFVSGAAGVAAGGAATAGLVTGAARVGGSVGAFALTTAGRVTVGVVGGAVGGAAGGATGQVVNNAIRDEPLDKNVGWATLTGAAIGAVFGGVTSAFYFPGPRGPGIATAAEGDAYATQLRAPAPNIVRNPQVVAPGGNATPAEAYVTWRDLMGLAPRGVANDFAPGANIKFGMKFTSPNVPRSGPPLVGPAGTHFEVRFHSPQPAGLPATRGNTYWTAKVGWGTSGSQINKGRNLLQDNGLFTPGNGNQGLFYTHLRFRFWSWT